MRPGRIYVAADDEAPAQRFAPQGGLAQLTVHLWLPAPYAHRVRAHRMRQRLKEGILFSRLTMAASAAAPPFPLFDSNGA